MARMIPPLEVQERASGFRLALGGGRGQFADRAFQVGVGLAAAAIVAFALGLAVTMLQDGLTTFTTFGPAFITSTDWNPVRQLFGVLPAIYGTLVTSALALILALPVGIGAAIFLAEIAPPRLAEPVAFLIELLAAIPSVIIGLWGLFALVPVIRQFEATVGRSLSALPLFSGPAYGIGLLAAGVILAIMILPILTAVTRDVLLAVPNSQREAMLALGATRWETISRAVLPYGRSGIMGAIILALGRALGETLAVSMVIGNIYQISPSLFAPATTLASLIATQFREADTELYLSALIAAGFVLFAITTAVNILARVMIWQLNAGAGR